MVRIPGNALAKVTAKREHPANSFRVWPALWTSRKNEPDGEVASKLRRVGDELVEDASCLADGPRVGHALLRPDPMNRLEANAWRFVAQVAIAWQPWPWLSARFPGVPRVANATRLGGW